MFAPILDWEFSSTATTWREKNWVSFSPELLAVKNVAKNQLQCHYSPPQMAHRYVNYGPTFQFWVPLTDYLALSITNLGKKGGPLKTDFRPTHAGQRQNWS